MVLRKGPAMAGIRTSLLVLTAVAGLAVPLPSAIAGERDLQAMDPGEAITLARAHLEEAPKTADAQPARRQHLEAAAILRRGILGLRGDDRTTVEHLPELYRLYVLTLTRLEMRHHATVSALAGVDQALQVIGRFAQRNKPNPWMRATTDGRIAWNHNDVTPVRLATDGLIIAGQLKARDPGMSGLYQALLDRLGRLDPPPCEGANLSRSHILAMMAEEDHESVLREADHLQRARPEEDLWVNALRNVAIPALAQRLRREGRSAEADDLLAHLARENAVMQDRMRSELANPDLPPARRREAERAMARLGDAQLRP